MLLYFEALFFKADQTEAMNLFVEKLLSLVKKKVRQTLIEVADNPKLFSHLIDECVAFENEVQGKTSVGRALLSGLQSNVIPFRRE